MDGKTLELPFVVPSGNFSGAFSVLCSCFAPDPLYQLLLLCGPSGLAQGVVHAEDAGLPLIAFAKSWTGIMPDPPVAP